MLDEHSGASLLANNAFDHLTFLVPTRNSDRWVGRFLGFYRDLGVEPLYLLDSRSTDNTEEILRTSGARIAGIHPKVDRVEGMLEIAADIVQSPWIARFDDDELPSKDLVSWLKYGLPNVEVDALWLSRRELFWYQQRLVYSRLEDYYYHSDDLSFLCPQLRVYRKDRVQYVTDIHTPGISTPRVGFAPDIAYFAHLDWLLRSPDERRKKLERYEAQKEGGGWGFARFYFPELHRQEDCRWTDMEDSDFNEIAKFAQALQSKTERSR